MSAFCHFWLMFHQQPYNTYPYRPISKAVQDSMSLSVTILLIYFLCFDCLVVTCTLSCGQVRSASSVQCPPAVFESVRQCFPIFFCLEGVGRGLFSVIKANAERFLESQDAHFLTQTPVDDFAFNSNSRSQTNQQKTLFRSEETVKKDEIMDIFHRSPALTPK